MIEEQQIEDDSNVNYREALRAVIVRNNKVLLIHSNKGGYEFPGGGIEGQENHSECLIREVAEETGYINCIITEKVGSVIERKFDKYDNTALFQMTSHYYLCELINDEKITQQLSDYESAQEYSPEWISLDRAIEQNEKCMSNFENNTWVKREIFVLKELENVDFHNGKVMEVDFMDSIYKCFIDIRFNGGDIQFEVSNDKQLFSFKSGIGFVAIPHFFSTLTSLYKGEISEAQLDCHGNSDYYKFSRDGTNLFIEHIGHYPEGIFTYQFKLKEYMEAIDTGFQKYLQQLEKEGILPLKTQEFGHPLGDDVLNAFYDFSSLINR